MLETTASKVNDLDRALGRVAQQDVLGLQVAVDDPVVAHEDEGEQHLAREAPDERSREADEAVRLDEFVQVDAEKFHRDTEVVTEVEVLRHLDDMVLLLGILIHAE